ncbi:MAG: carbohydrate ABC transporter permease [Tissierellia bacterium]|jgi:putative aldouronate transport system permease protein|nr:carbohydrate ABC transporter permease [Tissierellia bacterium]
MVKYKTGIGEKVFKVFNVTVLFLFGLTTLYPFIYIIALSLNEGVDSMKGGIWLFPRKFTLFNYQYVLSNHLIQNAYIITIGRTVIGTLLSISVTALVAYGLSYRNLPYKRGIMTFIIIPMVFNGGLIPYYLQLRALGLLNKFWVYIFPFSFSIFNMFVMRKFFMDIPESLNESAFIDGATYLQTLYKIVLPLSKPMLAALSLFTAVNQWNDWFSGAFYVSDLKLIPVQTYLQKILSADSLQMLTGDNRMVAEAAVRQGQYKEMTITAVKMSVVVIGTLPILCVYPFLQKYFVKGMLVGAIKG